MTEQPKLMTARDIRIFVNAALADPEVDLAIPLGLSLALREGLHTAILTTVSRGDYHPAVGDVPGSLTYRHGDQFCVATRTTRHLARPVGHRVCCSSCSVCRTGRRPRR